MNGREEKRRNVQEYRNDSTPRTSTRAKAAPPRAGRDIYILFHYLYKEEGLEPMQKQPHAHTPRQDTSLSDQTLGSPFIMIQFVPRLRLSLRALPLWLRQRPRTALLVKSSLTKRFVHA
jgi:hypothetical protein